MTYAKCCRQNTSSSRRGRTREKVGGDCRALLDELLPTLGQQMVAYAVGCIEHLPWGLEREVSSFRAYLE